MLRNGMYADVLVFDPDEITDKATYSRPSIDENLS